MRVTIELSDELWIATEKRAAELRLPVRDLVEAGLRAQLAGAEPPRKGAARVIHWVTVDGGLPEGVDITNRVAMHEWLRDQR